jgi:hypothetical protein
MVAIACALGAGVGWWKSRKEIVIGKERGKDSVESAIDERGADRESPGVGI